MHLDLYVISFIEFLKRIIIATGRKLGYYVARAALRLQDLNRFAPMGVHLPIYVNTAICLVPFRYSTTGNNHMQLKFSKGWRRVVCFIFQSIAISRALCVYSLCRNGNFHWTYHECFTGDAAVYFMLSLLCSYTVIAIMVLPFLGAEICEVYNSLRMATEILAGKNEGCSTYQVAYA